MKYANGRVSDVQIAYIGGGSRGWAWTFMTDLALEPSMSGTIRLYDIDEDVYKRQFTTSSLSQVRAAFSVYSWFSICGINSAFTFSGTFPATSGRMESLSKTALVSTTASAGRFGICRLVFGMLTLLTIRSRPHRALIRRMPSSPVGFSSTSSSPAKSLWLFSRRFFRSFFLQSTVVRPYFQPSTVQRS